MLEELRISQLGVIDSSTLELGPGLTVITGETGAGKTMVVTALGLLLGGRADSGAVRTGAKQARVEGVVSTRRRCPASARPWRTPAARSRTTRSCSPATSPRRAARVPGSAAPSVPVTALAELAEPLVAVHGQSDQHRLLRASAQRESLDRFGGAEAGRHRGVVRLAVGRARGDRARRWPRCSAPPASAPARPTSSGSGSARSRPSTRGRGRTLELAAEETRLGFADTLRTAAETGARGALQRGGRARRARHHQRGPARPRRRPRARRDGGRAGRPDRRARPPARRRRGRRGVLRLEPGDRPGAAGRACPSGGRR